MNDKAEALKRRTHDFFVRVIKFSDTIPQSAAGASIARQLVDAAGSMDSNYGAATKGRTRRQFIDKVGIASEEADESKRWLEALRDAGLGDEAEATALINEADELTAILVASHKTAKGRLEEAERREQAARTARNRRRRQSTIQSTIADPSIVNRQSTIRRSTIHDRRSAIDCT